MKKFLWISGGVIILALSIFIYFRFFFVFGEGVKAGILNNVMYKGYVFKTYEGRMIQTGFRAKAPGTVQSYEFEFSIVDKDIAEKLMQAGGKQVELRYKEYRGALPWRGYNKYVVNEIINISEPGE